MGSYLGIHAELYDIFYAEKDYKQEADFIHQCLRNFSLFEAKNLVELACGTGNHAFELENLGYEMTATDYSKDMIAQALKKKSFNNSKVNFLVQDMREPNPGNTQYDAVICLFDSIGYVKNNEAINQVFQNIKKYLKKDGLFIFEFWHAAAMIKFYEPLRVKKWNTEAGEIIRISETSIDYQQQLCTVNYSVIDTIKGLIVEESQENRYFSVQEMQLFLETNGFSLIRLFKGFNFDENIDENTWHIVAIASNQIV